MSAFLVLLGALEISAPKCPSAEQIAARWAELGVETLAGDAQISVDGDRLRLVLRDRDGNVRADRELRVPPSCSERAAIAAVVLAAWASPPSPPPTPAETEIVETEPPRSTRPAAPRRRAATEITAAFVGAVDSAGFAASGSLDLSVIDRRSGWGGHLSFVGGENRTLSLDQTDRAHFGRFPFSLGPRRRFLSSRAWHLHVDLSAEASFALVYARGQNQGNIQTAYSFDFGVGTGLRVGWGIGAWTPFIGVSVVGWLTRKELVVANTDGRAELPRVEGWFLAGISYEP